MNVETVSKSDCLTLCEVRLDIVLEDTCLLLIRCEDHDDVSFLCSLSCCVNLKSELLYMVPSLAAFIKTDDYIYTAVTKVKSVSVSLAAVTDDSNCFVLEYVDIAVRLIIDFWHFKDLQ